MDMRGSFCRRPLCVRRHLLFTFKIALLCAAAFTVVALPAPTRAGVADTPLPVFSDGKASVSVLTIPGVIKRSGLETVFLCTSVDSVAVDIGVEIFDPAGALQNNVNAGIGAALNVAPGATVTFGTGSTATYLETQVNLLPPAANIAQGSARIIASSPQVRCNVVILDDFQTPAVSIATLGAGVSPEPVTVPPTLALPQFSDGQTATHAAVFPGAVKRGDVETAVFCTSTAAANIDVGVEFIDETGAVLNSLAVDGGEVLGVTPGQTVTIASTQTSAFFETATATISPVSQGLARVVSNSADVVCNAVVVDAALLPPTSLAGLSARSAGASGGPTLASPLPPFSDGKASVHVVTFPGVMKRGQLQSLVMCTSIDTLPVNVGLQIFTIDGSLQNDVTAGVGAILGVSPGQTVTFGTSTTAAYLETTVVPTLNKMQGVGRVVASSDKVLCNAFIVDDLVSPPVTLGQIGLAVRPTAGAVPSSLPLPLFSDGHQATHSAIFPGVVKRGDAETDVQCTSIANGPIDIGVQILNPNGAAANDVSAGNGAILAVQPGSTVTFGTTGTAALLENTVITISGIAQGMARVVSDSDQLLCTATVLDAGLAPPGMMSAMLGFGAEAAVCGDGVIQSGEQCDGASDAACPGQCQPTCFCPQVCGDGFVQPGEQCDDGNAAAGDCCSATCQFEGVGAPCADDGNLCNGPESCDAAARCVSGPPLDCSDGSACTQDSCDALSGICVHDSAPATSCLTAVKASLQVKDHPTKPADQIKWKWSKGSAFAHGDLGDPSATTSYTLCIYDQTASVPALATSLTVTPSALLWQNKNPKGWKYKDKVGSSDGVVQVQLKPGLAGKTKAQVKAKGAGVPTPTAFSPTEMFDLDPDVTVQLFASDSPVCWTSSFTATATKKNTALQFKAKVR